MLTKQQKMSIGSVNSCFEMTNLLEIVLPGTESKCAELRVVKIN